MDLRDTIIDTMEKVMQETQGRGLTMPLEDASVLLETGLDSIGFAILVATLEENLGYDPFQLMDEPYYPRTLAEFVLVYENNRPLK